MRLAHQHSLSAPPRPNSGLSYETAFPLRGHTSLVLWILSTLVHTTSGGYQHQPRWHPSSLIPVRTLLLAHNNGENAINRMPARDADSGSTGPRSSGYPTLWALVNNNRAGETVQADLAGGGLVGGFVGWDRRLCRYLAGRSPRYGLLG